MSYTEKETIQGLRLSQQQRRLWSRARRGAAGPARCLVSLEGGLDAGALAAALRGVVRRHEILRTTFRLLPGLTIPLQVVGEDDAVELRRQDLGALAPEEQTRRLEALWEEEATRPFDLAGGPVVRASLARLGARRHALLLALPAACADARTLRNFLEELALVYDSLHGGAGPDEEPFQYADFAEWQNELQSEPEADAGRRFWAARLGAEHKPVRLPFSREPSGAHAQAVWGPESLPEGIEEAALLCGVGAQEFLLAVWVALLWRVGGAEDFLVSAEFDGRAFEELEGAFGLFARTLPVRCRVDAAADFGSLAARLAAELSEAAEWQDYFEASEDSRPGARDADPLAEARPAFSFVEEFRGAQAAGVRFTLLRQSVPPEAAALCLLCTRRGADFSFRLEYDAARHAEAEVARLGANFARLVSSACAGGPSAAVASLPMLGEEELGRLLGEWNDTRADYERDATVHELISRQAARTPDLAALTGGGVSLTYAELDGRSAALAARLRRLGAGPEAVVGVAAARRPETVVAMLGVLKSGAAYLPLELSSPAGRAAFMLENAGARLLVVASPEGEGAALAEAARRAGVRVVTLDGEETQAETKTQAGADTEGAAVAADGLAYVIYTSGSTGEPKGVMVTHRSLVNYSLALARRLGSQAGERYALISTLAADLCHTALYPALVTGGRAVICSEEEAGDGRLLARRVEAEGGVEYLKGVPSHVEALRRAGGGDVLPRKTLVVGGEASAREWAEGLAEEARGMGVLNHYGPTEATVGALTFRVGEGRAGEAADACATVPIGRPLANVRAYVVERHGGWQPAPIGVGGELYLGGDGLARGYIGRADLTAERFVPDPFSGEAGARLYRTGDLVRRLPGGEIEFLGRVDEQVKVRGYRIEPGEVEAVLHAIPGVAQAAVVTRQDAHTGSRQLVAYLVSQTRREALPPAAELRRMLSDRLPAYMIPSAFVSLEHLPLTPNGKLDRKALPAPGPERPELDTAYVEPRTEAERVLAEVWREVLGVSRVGAHDNFFELGGDSILSIRLAALATERGLGVTPRLLFEHQSVSALAAAAASTASAGAAGDAPAAEQGEVVGPVPLTPAQHHFLDADPADPHHFNQSVMLALAADSEAETHRRVFTRLLARHDALRLRFTRHEAEDGSVLWSQHNAGVEEAGAHDLERHDLCGLSAAAAAAELRRVGARMQRALDLARGPLVRAAHVRVAGGARLLVVAHHLCVDGVSWRVLLEDWRRLYEWEAGGRVGAEPLGAKTASYRQWAEALVERVGGGGLDAEAEYWAGVGAGAARRLPAEDERAPNVEGEAAELTAEVDEAVTGELLEGVCAAWRARPQEVVLAALGAALCRWAGVGRVAVTVEGHGREEWAWVGGDVTRTVGWFTSLYPVAVEAEGVGGLAGCVRAAKEGLRGAPGGGVGYGLLRHLSGEEGLRRRLAEAGRSAVVLNYLGRVGGAAWGEAGAAGAGGVEGAGEGAGVSGWRVAGKAGGAEASGRRARRYEVEATARVEGGRLRLGWRYARGRQRAERMREVLGWWVEGLRRMAEEWRGGAAPEPSTADFPEVTLDKNDLDELIGQLSD
jgi:amino acid adenylation domain-containing protein/non-ribosomal peptide synthase protein (TIGR01720 family)